MQKDYYLVYVPTEQHPNQYSDVSYSDESDHRIHNSNSENIYNQNLVQNFPQFYDGHKDGRENNENNNYNSEKNYNSYNQDNINYHNYDSNNNYNSHYSSNINANSNYNANTNSNYDSNNSNDYNNYNNNEPPKYQRPIHDYNDDYNSVHNSVYPMSQSPPPPVYSSPPTSPSPPVYPEQRGSVYSERTPEYQQQGIEPQRVPEYQDQKVPVYQSGSTEPNNYNANQNYVIEYVPVGDQEVVGPTHGPGHSQNAESLNLIHNLKDLIKRIPFNGKYKEDQYQDKENQYQDNGNSHYSNDNFSRKPVYTDEGTYNNYNDKNYDDNRNYHEKNYDNSFNDNKNYDNKLTYEPIRNQLGEEQYYQKPNENYNLDQQNNYNHGQNSDYQMTKNKLTIRHGPGVSVIYLTNYPQQQYKAK